MTESEAIDYLIDRGERHGLSLSEVLDMIPDTISSDMPMSAEFVEGKHFSHILAQSTHPELANDWDNIIAEDASTNMARGAEVITPTELKAIKADNAADAAEIEVDYADDSLQFLENLLELVAA